MPPRTRIDPLVEASRPPLQSDVAILVSLEIALEKTCHHAVVGCRTGEGAPPCAPTEVDSALFIWSMPTIGGMARLEA